MVNNHAAEKRVRAKYARYALAIASLGYALFCAPLYAQVAGPGAAAPKLPPIDPQMVQDQDDMTWNDYHPIPGGADWTDPAKVGSLRTVRIALIAADFEDQPFVITLPKGSDPFKNPQIDPIKREDVPKFYMDIWNSPANTYRQGHTAHEYWMEQSHGQIGVSMQAFGPYRMPKKYFQYGLAEWGAQNSGPEGVPVDGNPSRDVDQLWAADAGTSVRQNFDLVLRYYAGYDETGVWQEFGEMKFQDQDSITPEFGNPDPNKPRWAPTRYVPWTSWRAAQGIWSNAAILNSESSGAIIHEIAHAAFATGDNNNNPYVTPYRRVGSGPWDTMDRGSFNGPGGPHNRWQIPATFGGSMPAGMMLRQKLYFRFVAPTDVVMLSREGLAKSGLAVVNVIARSANPGPDSAAGVTVRLDGEPVPIPAAAIQGGGRGRGRAALRQLPGRGAGTRGGDRGDILFPTVAQQGVGGAATTTQGGGEGLATTRGRGGGGGRGRGPIAGRGPTIGVTGLPQGMTNDRTPWEDPATHPLSQGIPNYTYYSMEVVQRMGYDSFTPDNGVLIAKNKDVESTNGGINGFNCFNWVIDAHPEDINKLDFKRPNGEPVMRTIADYRQLNDALFHAGLNSGSQYEWEDTPNRLHFYIIDTKKDDKGVLFYTVGVRSLDGAGPQQHGVALKGAAPVAVRAENTPCTFSLTNTGTAATTDPALHGQDVSAHLTSDIYRLSVTVQGDGWSAQLQNALAAVKFGESQNVPVFVTRTGTGGAATATITLKATSESDPSKTVTATCTVSQP